MRLKLTWYKFKSVSQLQNVNCNHKEKGYTICTNGNKKIKTFHCKKLNTKETLIQHDRNTSLSIITLNVNGLNSPFKRQIGRIDTKITLSNYMLSTRDSPDPKKTTQYLGRNNNIFHCGGGPKTEPGRVQKYVTEKIDLTGKDLSSYGKGKKNGDNKNNPLDFDLIQLDG